MQERYAHCTHRAKHARVDCMWITRGVVLLHSWQPVTQLLDHRPSLPTDMLERVLFCLGHCLVGHQKDRFSLGNGTTSTVVSAVCRDRDTQPLPPEKYDPHQWWKMALTIALLRRNVLRRGDAARKDGACMYPVSLAAPSARCAPVSFFLSWVSKTQTNHWTKRMANT